MLSGPIDLLEALAYLFHGRTDYLCHKFDRVGPRVELLFRSSSFTFTFKDSVIEIGAITHGITEQWGR